MNSNSCTGIKTKMKIKGLNFKRIRTEMTTYGLNEKQKENSTSNKND